MNFVIEKFTEESTRSRNSRTRAPIEELCEGQSYCCIHQIIHCSLYVNEMINLINVSGIRVVVQCFNCSFVRMFRGFIYLEVERHQYSKMHIDLFGERFPKESREELISVRCEGEREFQLTIPGFGRTGCNFEGYVYRLRRLNRHAKLETVIAEGGPWRR